MMVGLVDAVDGSSTGTRVPRMWGRLRLPRFGGAIHAIDFDNRSRYRQVCLSSAWRRCGRPGGDPSAKTSLRGKRRFSDVDAERARLLQQYTLHRASADAQRLADLQYARAALLEPQDTLFQLGPAHAPITRLVTPWLLSTERCGRR